MIDRKTAVEALDQAVKGQLGLLFKVAFSRFSGGENPDVVTTALHNGLADVLEHEDAMRAVIGEVFGT